MGGLLVKLRLPQVGGTGPGICYLKSAYLTDSYEELLDLGCATQRRINFSLNLKSLPLSICHYLSNSFGIYAILS